MGLRITFAAATAVAAAMLAANGDAAVTSAAAVNVTVYRNAQVWDGNGFVARTLYIAGHNFLGGVPAGATSTEVDLQNGYVVPALGSAHEHKVNPNPESDWSFFSDGVFYVWNVNSIVESDARRAYFNRPTTVDYATAMGGISEPDGHPEILYTEVLRRFIYRDSAKSDFINDAYHYGRSPKEIDDALDRLSAQGANFVKAFLLFSEDYAARKLDPRTPGSRGLSPANFTYLVDAARRRGLKTLVHVESTADLLTAARAGAAVAAHVPGYDVARSDDDPAKMRITPSQARMVVRSGMLLVPTYSVSRGDFARDADAKKLDVAKRDRAFALQGANLRNLYRAGGIFMTGTDQGSSIAEEAQQWVDVGGMPRLAALKFMLATGRRMFPDRRIGCFDPGCVADFLVLRADPRIDLSAFHKIALMVKDGAELKEPPAKPSPTLESGRTGKP